MFIGQVVSNASLEREGIISVKRLDSRRNKIDSVYYTSPFGGVSPQGRAGFYAFPNQDSWVAYAETDSLTGVFIYLGTIHKDFYGKVAKSTDEDAVKTKKLKSKEGAFPKGLYNPSGAPEAIIIKDKAGNNLSFHDYSDKYNGQKKGVHLRSSSGKQLLLDDSPNNNAIRLLNEAGYGISIAGRYTKGKSSGFLSGQNDIDITTKANINVKSDAGTVTVKSETGGGVEIECAGIGLNTLMPRIPPAAPYIPVNEPPGPFFRPYGCVKLDSQYRDICIFSGKGHKDRQTLGTVAWPPLIHRSRIMLRAYGETGSVQIRSDGSISICAPNNRVYVHAASLHMLAEDDLNLRSKGSINMMAGTTIRMMTAPDIEENRLIPRAAGALSTDYSEYAYDLARYEVDNAEYLARTAPGAPPVPAPLGTLASIQLNALGVSVDGPRIDLAPVVPQTMPLRAIHPTVELSDYEIALGTT